MLRPASQRLPRSAACKPNSLLSCYSFINSKCLSKPKQHLRIIFDSPLVNPSNVQRAAFSIGAGWNFIATNPIPYFISSQPDLAASSSSSLSLDPTSLQVGSLNIELQKVYKRYSVPLVPPSSDFFDTQYAHLCQYIYHQDTIRSWDEFQRLCHDSERQLPLELLDSLFSCIAQGPTDHTHPSDNSLSAVCEKLETLWYKRESYGNKRESHDIKSASYEIKRENLRSSLSKETFSVSIDDVRKLSESTWSPLEPQYLRRFLHLLLSNQEHSIASLEKLDKDHTRQPSTSLLLRLVSQLEGNPSHLEPLGDHAQTCKVDLDLRARLVSVLLSLKDVDTALEQLEALVHDAQRSGQLERLESDVFEQVLESFGSQSLAQTNTNVPPLPVDPSRVLQENAKVMKAIQITLAANVGPSKIALHQALDTLDSSTLYDLLPFALEMGSASTSSDQPQARFIPRLHPWESQSNGPTVTSHVIQLLGERIALTLAERGDLAPALYLLEQFEGQPSHSISPEQNFPLDQDLYTAIVSTLAKRMRKLTADLGKINQSVHRTVLDDLRIVMRIYSVARKHGIELDPRTHEAMMKTFSVALRTSVVNLGSFASAVGRVNHTRAHVASQNQSSGSMQLLQLYLRNVTTAILSKDPTLQGGSLSYEAHASLLGLHMKLRDYSYSKRLYQLIRLRDSNPTLWSHKKSDKSLYSMALDGCSGPDPSCFNWLFVESIRASNRPHFATRLYLDWIASGNRLTSWLAGFFIRSLLRTGLDAVAKRLLKDLHEQQAAIPSHLAKAFVASFADAGYPQHAIHMAMALNSQAIQGQALGISNTPSPSSVHDRNDTNSLNSLTSTMELYSVALERVSKAQIEWSSSITASTFKLFDEFRLALSHYYLKTSSLQIRDSSTEVNLNRRLISVHMVRKAYNAAIRSHLEGSGSDTKLQILYQDRQIKKSKLRLQRDHLETDSELSTVYQVSRQQISKLVAEMKDMSIDPDDETWSLLILAQLKGLEHHSSSSIIETPKDDNLNQMLLRAMQLFKESSEATFLTSDGSLPSVINQDSTSFEKHPSHGSVPDQHQSSPTEEVEDVSPVLIKPTVAAMLMAALTDGGHIELSLRVYKIYTMQSSLKRDKAVGNESKALEWAKLYTLAAQEDSKSSEMVRQAGRIPSYWTQRISKRKQVNQH